MDGEEGRSAAAAVARATGIDYSLLFAKSHFPHTSPLIIPSSRPDPPLFHYMFLFLLHSNSLFSPLLSLYRFFSLFTVYIYVYIVVSTFVRPYIYTIYTIPLFFYYFGTFTHLSQSVMTLRSGVLYCIWEKKNIKIEHAGGIVRLLLQWKRARERERDDNQNFINLEVFWEKL